MVRASSWVGIALGLCSIVTPAAAQYGLAQWRPIDASPTCNHVDTRLACADGGACTMPLRCVDVAPMVAVCAPEDALFCIPVSSAVCPAFRPTSLRLGTVTVCLPAGAALCAGGRAADCFTAPAAGGMSRFPVDFAAGDCDFDGLPNSIDPVPCTPPPRVMFISPSRFCEAARPCAAYSLCDPGTVCSMVAGVSPNGYCLPSGPAPVFCCGGLIGADCPAGEPCIPTLPDDFAFCPDPEYCPDWTFSDRVACLADGATFPVDRDLGDCDGDRIPNGADERPCDFDVVDAGVPVPDATVPGEDGGVGIDAAIGIDGGVVGMDAGTVIPTFGGGGGCACRAAPQAGGSVAWWLVLLGLVGLRRRDERIRR